MASSALRALPLAVAATGLLGVSLLLRLPSAANPSPGAVIPPLSPPVQASPGAPAVTVPAPPVPPRAPGPPAAPGPSAAPAAGPPLPTRAGLPTASDGRHYPLVPADPAATATLLAQVEEALRSAATAAADMPALGHQQQVIYRVLAYQPEQTDRVRAALPERWRPVFDRHIRARREFIAMHDPRRRPANLPAWRIVPPEPAANLLRYYREAAAATGIPWEVLAAVNLVESGMGRIDGVSVADAHGPMQFLPSTWAEPGIGNGGNIRDPRTAINAAARYLVRRGGLRVQTVNSWRFGGCCSFRSNVHVCAGARGRNVGAGEHGGLYYLQGPQQGSLLQAGTLAPFRDLVVNLIRIIVVLQTGKFASAVCCEQYTLAKKDVKEGRPECS